MVEPESTCPIGLIISDAARQLPHYDDDLDRPELLPTAVAAFRSEVAAANAVLVVTPEYNGSLPGALKNAIDWASRPRGNAPIDGLPTAVLSVSPSPRAAQWAREDAVKVLTVAGAVVEDRSAGIGRVHEVLSDEDHVDLVAVGALVERLVEDTLVAA
nr:NAD(P)H-dependent oxidoreductase [Kineosphaera limosa]